MAAHTKLWPELQATFIQDLKTSTQLRTLLGEERSLLETRQYDQLSALTEKKHVLLAELQAHIQARQTLFEVAGFRDESSVLESAEQQAPSVAKAWRQLASLWAECQEKSAINERIIERTRQVVGQTLDIIRGSQHQQKLYDTKGKTSSSGLGRTITSA